MNKAVLFIIGIFVLLTGMYVINPYHVPTKDPRSRILGITTYRIASSAMAPSLIKNELILVNSATYASRSPSVGDIIAFRFPEDRKIDFVFRVAAVAGDRLNIKDGVVYVNGKPQHEPYLDAAATSRDYSQHFDEILVPADQLFVLGDNRDNARDGRYWGFVPYQDVIGKVTYIWLSEDKERIGSVH